MSVKGNRKNNQNYEKRVAIVTGGTRGIGFGICKALGCLGIKLILVYRENVRLAKKAEMELKELGIEASIIKANVSKKSEAKRIVDFTGNRYERIDILINNAGIFDYSFIEEMTEDFFDRTYAINFKSVLFMIQAVIPWMKSKRYGRIINASSISGSLADVGLSAYGCSKAGVNMLTRIAAAELAPYGITVNAYSPGIIATDMTKDMIDRQGHTQIKQIPARRFGDPADVAGLVRFLCSDGASYITGEIIGIDGGMLKVQNPNNAYEHVNNANRKGSEKTL
jgi:3-oxoacyl-[acyl-carrier protein] reductase